VAACVTRTKGAAGYVSAAASTAGVKTLESNSGAENLPRSQHRGQDLAQRRGLHPRLSQLENTRTYLDELVAAVRLESA
jgi:hypothetical protein